MEDNKGLIDKVKELVFASEEVKEVEVVFADVKAEDGTILRTEGDLAVGSEVKIISEDGEAVSGEADYILEGGKTIKVDAEGKVTEIVEAEEEAKEEEKEGDKAPELETELAEDDKDKEEKLEEEKEEEKEDEKPYDAEAKIAELEAEMAKMKDLVEGLMSQFSEVSTQVQEFSALPADKEIKEKKQEFSSVNKKKTGLEALANFRNK